MKTKKLVIVGNTSNARLARYYFDIDSDYEVAAFAVNKEYVKEDSFEGLPLTALEDIEKKYPVSEYELFIAVGYTDMNKIRESYIIIAKKKDTHLQII